MTPLFSFPSRCRSACDSASGSDDDWIIHAPSDVEEDSYLTASSDSDEEKPVASQSLPSSVPACDFAAGNTSATNSAMAEDVAGTQECGNDISAPIKEKAKQNVLRKNTTSFVVDDVSSDASTNTACAEILATNVLQKVFMHERTRTKELKKHKVPTMSEPSSELAKLVEKCDSMANDSAQEVDSIARALSRKLDGVRHFRNSKRGGPTPEQSLYACARFRDNAERLYKRFARRGRVIWDRLNVKQRAKYNTVKSGCDTVKLKYEKLRVDAERTHKLHATVASYAKWKEAEAAEEEIRLECNTTMAKAWELYNEISGDAWTKHRLELDEARDASDRVHAEYKRARSLMSDLTEVSDLPRWKQLTVYVGVPLAAVFSLGVVISVCRLIVNPAQPKFVDEMVRIAVKEEFGKILSE
ncbi:hypothetical protein FKW77_005202 [Venturia effusa]|uniref:Uncharacterized protein n=1 Tax=Venturia effusa TaxID=50376 RepID=A0A517L7C2_9PEZI|nr:hypothetical protein FKW77_005202 [Venturia effusa]